jgi:phage terminase small subunit
MRAAGMDRNDPTKTQYKMLSDLVRLMASEHGLTPRTTQALIWIVKRGSAS